MPSRKSIGSRRSRARKRRRFCPSQRPEGAAAVRAAIRVGTLNGAYASFEEGLKGSLEAGKLADMVGLGRNPLREDPSTLVSIPVERTMVGGQWVFEA